MLRSGSIFSSELSEAVESRTGRDAEAAALTPQSDPNYQKEIEFVSGITAGGLVSGDAYWAWNNDTPATFDGPYSSAHKFGDPTAGTPGTISYFFDPASHWTIAQKDAFIAAMTLWSWEANVTFVQASTLASASIDIRKDSTASTASSSVLGTSFVGSAHIDNSATGEVDVGPSIPIASSFTTEGGYGWATPVHELGHVLGLGHGGPYNGDVTPGTQQETPYDTEAYSIMSYIDPTDSTAKYYNTYIGQFSWGTTPDGYANDPTTPMMLDIAAAQRIYGAPTHTPLDGNDVFGFHTNLTGAAAEFFDFTINTMPVITIYDQGVGNTLDLSGFAGPSSIDLAPGTFSSTDGMTNNIAIAAGTIIQTAILSAGGGDIRTSNVSSHLIGSDVGDTLTGGTGNDFLEGEGGADTLLGNAGNDVLDGGAGNDSINGGAGNDIIDGGAGTDELVGGAGNDLYVNVDAGDRIFDSFATGTDTIQAGISFALPFGVSVLQLTGTAAINGFATYAATIIGNDAANTLKALGTANEIFHGGGGDDHLIGNTGNDQLIGGVGNDTIEGGQGNDFYSVDSVGDVVVELAGAGTDTVATSISFTLASGISIEELMTNAVLGTAGLALRGNALSQRIDGNAGNNLLVDGGGGDTLAGHAGNDTYAVSSAADIVVETAGQGVDAVVTSVSYTLSVGSSIETLMTNGVLGTADLTLRGNALSQRIDGNAGNNLLNGGGGGDTLAGHAGNDLYAVFSAGDVIVEAANQGSDTVSSAVSYVLGAGVSVEALTTTTVLGTAAINLTGNEQAQRIDGNAGANILSGGAGADALYGHDGDDRLIGGAGRDTIDSGTGNDVIAYGPVSDSTSLSRDLVIGLDFSHDRLNLPFLPTGIDATVTHGALNTVSFDGDLRAAIGATQLTAHHAVLFDPDGGDLNLAGHVFLVIDANGVAGYQAGQDYVVELQNATGTLTLADFT